MDIEEAFRTVGEFGPYQKQAVAIVVLTQVGWFGFSTQMEQNAGRRASPSQLRKNVATWLKT